MEKEKLVFFVDFDGTITKRDVCEAIVTELASEGWIEINDKWENKQLSTLECARETFKLFKRKDPQAFKDIANTIEIDDEFHAFVAYCKNQGYPIYILSDGYDYYIDYILRREGLSLPYYANKLIFSSEIEIQAPYQSNHCDFCGVCKTELMLKLQKPFEKSIYIGDGSSDFCPAEKVNYVFAKKKLYDYCVSLGRQVDKFESFHDILQRLYYWEKEAAK